MPIRIEEYVLENGDSPYQTWFDRLDAQTAAEVATARQVPLKR